MSHVIAFIVQIIASSALAIAGFICVSFTKLGERFLNHRLEKRIGELKHAHDRDIESLRADLAHLQDRGRRANELEFDALTKILAFIRRCLAEDAAIDRRIHVIPGSRQFVSR
jgi:hypothetical protein